MMSGGSVANGGTVAGDLVVNGNLTMGVGKVLTIDSGTGASGVAPLTARGSAPNSGVYASTPDQFSIARLGLNQMNLSSSGGPSANTTFTTAGSLVVSSTLILQAALRRVPATPKTSNYVLLATDNKVIAGVGCSIITTPATPVTGMGLVLLNQSGGAVTLTANSGQTIDGAGTASLADNSMTLLELGADGVTWYAGEIPTA